MVNENGDHRIIDHGLWARVKARQAEVGELFTHTTTNRLNASHRPSYMLSGNLECAECGGPYAISGKDRYSCTHNKKQVPVGALDGACCQNQKTILRSNLEERVVGCVPAAFLHLGIFDRVAAEVLQRQEAKLKCRPSQNEQLASDVKKAEQQQANIIQQISDRANEGRPRLTALDDKLDQLEAQRGELTAKLAKLSPEEPDITDRLAELRDQVNPEAVQRVMALVLFHLSEGMDTDAMQPFIAIIRRLVQKVVIGKTSGHQPASLEVHGQIA